jgi:hypothetical protein
MSEKKQPDRYTMLRCNPTELAQHIVNINFLGLKWFCRGDYGSDGRVNIYVFFDELGLQKYLSQEWGSTLDMVRGWINEVDTGEISDTDFTRRCIELLGDE